MYELIAEGAIETVVVGTRRLVPEESLVEFVARLRGQAQADPGRPAA